MEIAAKDISLLEVAIDIFIRTGNPALANEAQRSSNERVALLCISKLGKEDLVFSQSECRVIYMAISFMLENLAFVRNPKAMLYSMRLTELKNIFGTKI